MLLQETGLSFLELLPLCPYTQRETFAFSGKEEANRSTAALAKFIFIPPSTCPAILPLASSRMET
ncbi:Uncharacterised protein [Mycobacterium tuberculosis]|nr:Uncharacterised protein [Mycobacterium tuberculosis]